MFKVFFWFGGRCNTGGTKKQNKKCRFLEQIHDWKHLYLGIFSGTTFRNSAITPAKCTTRRWTLSCSHHSVAKRQQFSCPLRTATLSLKCEYVVPEGWI